MLIGGSEAPTVRHAPLYKRGSLVCRFTLRTIRIAAVVPCPPESAWRVCFPGTRHNARLPGTLCTQQKQHPEHLHHVTYCIIRLQPAAVHSYTGSILVQLTLLSDSSTGQFSFRLLSVSRLVQLTLALQAGSSILTPLALAPRNGATIFSIN